MQHTNMQPVHSRMVYLQSIQLWDNHAHVVQVHHKQKLTQTATDSLEFFQKQPYPLASQMEHSTAQAGRAGQGGAGQ